MSTVKLTSVVSNAKEIFEAAYNGSYYTITGCGGKIQDWIDGYTDLLKEKNIGTPKSFITFKGKDMNIYYNLKGDWAYPDDLTFLAFPLDGLDAPKLAGFKLCMEDKWFDDIVDNNKRHMEEMEMYA